MTPYLWASGISGETRPVAGGPTIHFDQSFKDVLEDLDGAFFLTGTARRDRFVFLGDFSWSAVSTEGTVSPFGFPVAAVDGEVSQFSLTLAAGYSVVETPGFVLDLFGGARGWHIDAEVSAESLLPPPYAGLGASVSDTLAWVDPIVGARARLDLSPNWSLIGYADIGGAGVGSDLTWQAVGTVNYRVNDHFYLSGGYRYLSVDYEDDGKVLDFDMSGPLFGATFRY